ncbi:hypothetical protein P7K49_028326, partial [Saguinus oedipus]
GSRVGRGVAGLLSRRGSASSSSRPLSLRRPGNPPRTPPPCWVGKNYTDWLPNLTTAKRPEI